MRADLDHEAQPDLVLIKTPGKGGQTQISAEDYIEGAPELVLEIVGSSSAYDLHQKKDAYRRNAVREYIAWITGEKRVLWWELRESEYIEIPRDGDGSLKSRVFPGLWLASDPLIAGDMKAVLAGARCGLDSPEYRAFIAS